MRFRGAFLVVAMIVLVMAYGVELPIGMEFVSIPYGRFEMGSSSSDRDTERPVHTVYIDEFEMMTTEVTQGMWEEVMGESIYDLRDAQNSSWELYGVGSDYPVYYVSWKDCQEFVDRLNEMDTGHTYRLPSESEWEYACRAGTTTEYYWGDSSSESVMGQYCWYDESVESGSTHPVAQKLPNAWGLYDMSGNVWEWCEDRWHDDYNGAPNNGSAWTSGSSDSRVVIRGGSWDLDASFCRSARRGISISGFYIPILGFRLSRQVRFSQSGSVITDNVTNLQWCVGPDSDTDWFEAEDWVDNLGGDWRMPTRTELQGLWDAGISDESWGYFKNSGCWVWSGELQNFSSAWHFPFSHNIEYCSTRPDSYNIRAFAVRSR